MQMFLSLRKMACSMHAREIEESTITSLYSHIGALRKEQKTCLVNLSCRKDVFANPADGLQQKLDISAVSMFGKTHIIFRKTSCSL